MPPIFGHLHEANHFYKVGVSITTLGALQALHCVISTACPNPWTILAHYSNMSILPPVSGHSSAATMRLAEPLREFRDLLSSCTRKSVIHAPHRDFILVQRMLSWFRSEYAHSPLRTNTGRILMTIWGGSNEPVGLINELLQAMSPLDERCWLKVFIVLLRMDKGVYIEHFWKARLLDKRLPISRGDLLRSVLEMPLHESESDRRQFTDKFVKLQYELCTRDSLDGRKLEDSIILPVCKMEPIRPMTPEDLEAGKEVKVFLVEVPCDSISPNILENIKSEPFSRGEDDDDEKYHEFALKVLKNDKEYKRESFAYSALRGSDGIVQCLGNWEIQRESGKIEYHLLLEYGSYDLDDYFENFAPPSLARAIIKFWEQLIDVAVALDKIHNLQHNIEERTRHYYGWHGDIKPENLVFCEGKWKIADPGFARIEEQIGATLDEGFPVVMLEGGTEYYGPPEQALVPQQPVTQLFDVWSLGCVFSEAATWLVLGYRGVEQFRMVRKLMQSGDADISLTKIEGDDCFHNGTDVSQGVLVWHKYLRNSLREKDRITGAILNLIEEKMLLANAKERISSKDLVHRLKNIVANAKKDKALASYSPPPYFKVAFEEEQVKRATELSKPMGKTRKSNRYKSTRVQNSPGSVPMNLEVPAFDRHHIYTPVLETAFPDNPTAGGQGTLLDAPQILISEQNVEKFDYWDALYLLESQGWVYKGTFERPMDEQATEAISSLEPTQSSQVPALISPPLSLKSPSPVPPDKGKHKEVLRTTQRGAYRKSPPVSQNRSIAISSFTQKFSRWKRGNKDARDTASQKASANSITASSPPITSSLTSSRAMEMDIKLKNSDIEDHFVERDIVFLLDNGSTMAKHWPRVRELVATLVTLLHGQDDNGMEMYFTSSETKHGPITEPFQFVDIINQMKPKVEISQDRASISEAKRADDIRKALAQILSLVGQTTYKRKLTLIILTDGIWKGISNRRTVADRIVTSFQEWQDEDILKEMLEIRGLSIQFVQFGDDKAAEMEFEYMDNHLVKSNGEKLPDIIDVEPATGNIWKMILGSLSTIWDDGGPPTIASDDSRSRLGRSESLVTSNPTQFLERRSAELVEEPMGYSQGQKYFNSAGATDYSGAQFEQMSPRSSGHAIRQAKDPRVSYKQRRGTKDSISTIQHAQSRNG